MTIQAWLSQSWSYLQSAGIGTARLDCLVLLEDILDKDRSWLLAHPEFELEAQTLHDLATLINRRELHEPLAYIRGKTEFYGREFVINHDVLEPRPESETIIELLKSFTEGISMDKQHTNIIDVGTGSGALAVTAKLELPMAHVTGIDIDPGCLAVARENAIRLHADITLLEGNLTDPVQNSKHPAQQYTVILANLPYVPDSYQINQAALAEPRIAIFGGKDGLDLYRLLFTQIDHAPNKPSLLLTESLPFQHSDLAQIARKHGYSVNIEDDFIQAFKPE